MEDIIVFLIVLGFGLLFCVFGIVEIRDRHRRKTWPRTSGTVISAKVKFDRGDADMNSSSIGLDVVYTYTVSGTHYRAECYLDSNDNLYDYLNDTEPEDTEPEDTDRGNTIGRCLSSLFGFTGRDDDLLENSVGKAVTVYFDPTQPQSSLLRTGNIVGAAIFTFLGGVILFLAGVTLWTISSDFGL